MVFSVFAFAIFILAGLIKYYFSLKMMGHFYIWSMSLYVCYLPEIYVITANIATVKIKPNCKICLHEYFQDIWFMS